MAEIVHLLSNTEPDEHRQVKTFKNWMNEQIFQKQIQIMSLSAISLGLLILGYRIVSSPLNWTFRISWWTPNPSPCSAAVLCTISWFVDMALSHLNSQLHKGKNYVLFISVLSTLMTFFFLTKQRPMCWRPILSLVLSGGGRDFKRWGLVERN